MRMLYNKVQWKFLNNHSCPTEISLTPILAVCNWDVSFNSSKYLFCMKEYLINYYTQTANTQFQVDIYPFTLMDFYIKDKTIITSVVGLTRVGGFDTATVPSLHWFIIVAANW